MPNKNLKPQKELYYYLTLFKVEGHRTWRSHLTGYAEGFNDHVTKLLKVKVTDVRRYKVDRINGEIIGLNATDY